MLAAQTARSPFTFRAVSHGGEAIDYLSGSGRFSDRERYPYPTLILLDLKMPMVDGFEVLRWMRAQSSATMPPVIVLSYSNLEEDRRLARELGAARYSVKPLDFDGAVAFVSGLVEFLATWSAGAAAGNPIPGVEAGSPRLNS
jgi:DNA-binding response OmpR family regulator